MTQTAERVLLTEVYAIRPGLSEAEGGARIVKIGENRYRVRAKGQHCGVVNRNNRRYQAEKTWGPATEAKSPFMQRVRSRRCIGHLEHPADGRSNLGLAAILVTDVERPNASGEVFIEFETLSTPGGRIVTNLIEDNVGFGISSRARGSVVRADDGVDDVQEDFEADTFDLVTEESTPAAEVAARKIREARQAIIEAARGDLVRAAVLAEEQGVQAADLRERQPAGAGEFLMSLPDKSAVYRAYANGLHQWEVYIEPHNLAKSKITNVPVATLVDAKKAAENHARTIVPSATRDAGAPASPPNVGTFPDALVQVPAPAAAGAPVQVNIGTVRAGSVAEAVAMLDPLPYAGLMVRLVFESDDTAEDACAALADAGFNAWTTGVEVCVYTTYNDPLQAKEHIRRVLAEKGVTMNETVRYGLIDKRRVVWEDKTMAAPTAPTSTTAPAPATLAEADAKDDEKKDKKETKGRAEGDDKDADDKKDKKETRSESDDKDADDKKERKRRSEADDEEKKDKKDKKDAKNEDTYFEPPAFEDSIPGMPVEDDVDDGDDVPGATDDLPDLDVELDFDEPEFDDSSDEYGCDDEDDLVDLEAEAPAPAAAAPPAPTSPGMERARREYMAAERRYKEACRRERRNGRMRGEVYDGKGGSRSDGGGAQFNTPVNDPEDLDLNLDKIDTPKPEITYAEAQGPVTNEPPYPPGTEPSYAERRRRSETDDKDADDKKKERRRRSEAEAEKDDEKEKGAKNEQYRMIPRAGGGHYQLFFNEARQLTRAVTVLPDGTRVEKPSVTAKLAAQLSEKRRKKNEADAKDDEKKDKKEKRHEHVVRENAYLRHEVSRLEGEKAQLAQVIEAMAAFQRTTAVEHRVRGYVAKYPVLEKVRARLVRCESVADLDATVREYAKLIGEARKNTNVKAVVEATVKHVASAPAPVAPAASKVETKTSGPSSSSSTVRDVPTPSPALEERATPAITDETRENAPSVLDGTFSRLAASRRRQGR